MIEEEYIFTDEQRKSIAGIMVNCWGGHMQTGYDHEDTGYPVLWTQLGPNYARARFVISPDGSVQEAL
jgi:hypothetical protein